MSISWEAKEKDEIKVIPVIQTLGDLILHTRLSLNISQRKLAELSGVAQSRISNYEKNKNEPSSDNLAKLMKAMGKQVSYVVSDIDETETHIE